MPVPLSFRWPGDFIDRIDRARGEVPRSKWIKRVIETELQRLGQTSARTPKQGQHKSEEGKGAPNRSPQRPTSARAPITQIADVLKEPKVSPNGEGCPQHGTEHAIKSAMAGKRMFKCKVCGEMWPA